MTVDFIESIRRVHRRDLAYAHQRAERVYTSAIDEGATEYEAQDARDRELEFGYVTADAERDYRLQFHGKGTERLGAEFYEFDLYNEDGETDRSEGLRAQDKADFAVWQAAETRDGRTADYGSDSLRRFANGPFRELLASVPNLRLVLTQMALQLVMERVLGEAVAVAYRTGGIPAVCEIARMTARQAETVTLSVKGVHTEREIAGVMGISQPMVNRHLSGARKKLREVQQSPPIRLIDAASGRAA